MSFFQQVMIFRKFLKFTLRNLRKRSHSTCPTKAFDDVLIDIDAPF